MQGLLFSGNFQGKVPLRISIKHPEEVVVGPRHNRTICAIPAALILVKGAVILTQRAQFASKVQVDLIGSQQASSPC